MGIFGTIKNLIFRKKEVEPSFEETGTDLGPLSPLREEREAGPAREALPYREPPAIEPAIPHETGVGKEMEMSNLKAKLDLLLTQIENISLQNRTIDERLKAIEKTLAEMRGIRYY